MSDCPPVTCRLARFLLPSILLCWLATALAGYAAGSAVNVALVVNADSWASLAVANEYVNLRHVPPSHVIYLHNLPDFEQTDVATFRKLILLPVLATLEHRGLAGQIDYVVYSSDIPFRINVSADMKGGKYPRFITPWASINGLTYLYQYVGGKNPAYLDLEINHYARQPEPLLNAGHLTEQQHQAEQAVRQLRHDKKWDQALAAMEKLAAQAPRCPDVLVNLASLQAHQGQDEAAVQSLQRAVAAGYLDFAGLQYDKNFKDLQQRSDFRQLIAGMKARRFLMQPVHGFRNRYHWGDNGNLVTAGGASYLISTMLGVTSGRGNSLDEVLRCLRRSVQADGSKPSGTIYYMVNRDIRSVTRQWGFATAAAQLENLGVGAEVIKGTLPEGKSDVMGAMLGSANFNWSACHSTILPGAICGHLTSFGGIMLEGAGQTPISALIREGAAGSSGTVTEPYALQQKFPNPFIDVYYARGCTLGEAFYQSVTGPYQLLILGDPLCRPWANIPSARWAGLQAGEVVKGKLKLHPALPAAWRQGLDRCELFVDGRRLATCSPHGGLSWDTTGFPDGYHEVRLVAVAAGGVQTQGETITPVSVNNHGRKVTATLLTPSSVALGQPIKVTARATGCERLLFLQNDRVVAALGGPSGRVTIDSRGLGLGEVTLQPVGVTGRPLRPVVIGPPIRLDIVAPPPLPAQAQVANDTLAKGLLLSTPGEKPVVITSTREKDWLTKTGLKAGQSFSLQGSFRVPANDMYQFQVRAGASVSLAVDGHSLGEIPVDKWIMLPVSLASGAHQLTVEGQVGPHGRLALRFGGPGALSVGADRFRHRAP